MIEIFPFLASTCGFYIAPSFLLLRRAREVLARANAAGFPHAKGSCTRDVGALSLRGFYSPLLILDETMGRLFVVP